MSRRSSACAVAAMLALSNISSAVPVPAADTCIEDAPIQALQANEPAADLFCKDYAPWGPPEVTNTITSTKTIGGVTETSMVTSTPLVDITVAADFVVQVTTTALCSDEGQTTGTPDTTGQGSDPTADALSESDAVPSASTTFSFIGASVQSISEQGTTPPAAPVHAAAMPNGPLHAAPAPAHAEPAHVAHGRRDAPLPSYMASFAPEQVSSACSCLSAKVGAGTTTTTATVTATVETITKAYTTVHNSPILRYHNINYTATRMQTACASPTAAAAAA